MPNAVLRRCSRGNRGGSSLHLGVQRATVREIFEKVFPLSTSSSNPSARPAFWRSFPIFEDQSPELLARLGAVAVTRSWGPGEVLFQRGDPGDYLVALATGRVKLTLLTPQGRELILRHAEAGDTLGEFALFDHEPRSADATAVALTSGYMLSRRAFEDLSLRHPDLIAGVARYFCRRLRETTDQLESIALYNLEARAARFILFTLRQIHGDDLPAHPTLRLEISQTEIAAVLGASRPKVNRALQALTEGAALTRQGDAWVCDVALLRSFADPDAE